LTSTAGYVVWLIHAAVYASLWGLMPWIAGRLGLEAGAGVLAGTVGAVIPHWPGHGEALMALATALLMLGFLRRWTQARGAPTERSPSLPGSFLLGTGAGLAFHVQPALLLVVLGWMAFELWWSRDRRRWLSSALVTAGMALACLPWGWRNTRTFQSLFFVRSNLGLELRMGNHDGAAAAMDVMDAREEFLHPRTHEMEARRVQERGELVYMKEAGLEARRWITDHPIGFLRLTGSRMVHWWLGPLYAPPLAALVIFLTILAVVGACLAVPGLSVPRRAALLIPLATYPLVYYVVAYMPRYRQPIDWIFLLLAGSGVWRGIQRIKVGAPTPALPPLFRPEALHGVGPGSPDSRSQRCPQHRGQEDSQTASESQRIQGVEAQEQRPE